LCERFYYVSMCLMYTNSSFSSGRIKYSKSMITKTKDQFQYIESKESLLNLDGRFKYCDEQ
jgi:hypothetical protein